jgi:sec-independent protein translocase protein TatA
LRACGGDAVLSGPGAWVKPGARISGVAGGRPAQGARRKDMLNNIGLPGLLLIAVVVLVLFGRGKISSLMGEVGKGITAFKKGVTEGSKEIEQDVSDLAKDVTPESDKDKV